MLEVHNEDFKTIVPISVTGGAFNFNLFAVWAFNPDDRDGKYITQVWKAISYYDDLMRSEPTVIIGDFNSNVIWDYKKHKSGNHSLVVKALEEKGIYSMYHLHHKLMQGKELHPTFYLYRHKNKPYHIDYCFVSESVAKDLIGVEVGDYDYWIKYSDHVPMTIDFRNRTD